MKLTKGQEKRIRSFIRRISDEGIEIALRDGWLEELKFDKELYKLGIETLKNIESFENLIEKKYRNIWEEV